MLPFRGIVAVALLALRCSGQDASGILGSFTENFSDLTMYSAIAEQLPTLALTDMAVEVTAYDDTPGMMDISPFPKPSRDFQQPLDYGILNGDTVEYQRTFPWFVQFGNDRCGGTMIWPGVVMTTAQCIIKGIPSWVRIGPIGANDGKQVNVTAGYYYYGFFNTYPNTNDLALLVLNIDDLDVDNVKTVTMNTDNNYPGAGTPLSLIGYGTTSTGNINARSDTLQRTNAYRTVSKNECFVFWDAFGPPRKPVNTELNVCAEAPNVTGACRGDGGTPLFDTNFTQVGIASFGFCGAQTPDVFLRVSAYQSWLFSMTCKVAPGNKPSLCASQTKNCGSNSKLVAWASNKVSSLRGYFGFGK